MSHRSATQPHRAELRVRSTSGVGMHAGARSRSRVRHELALRPGFLSPKPGGPPTALRAPRGVEWWLLVLTAGRC